MNGWGVIFDWFPAVPVVHRFDNERLGEEITDDIGNLHFQSMTVCGRVVSDYDDGTGRMREPGQWIPARHALKIGRPCKKCGAVGEGNDE